MERLTVNKPVEEMGMYELAHNCCYVGDEGAARHRNFVDDIDARDFARKLMVKFGVWSENEKTFEDDDAFDETMLDNLQYCDINDMTLEGLITIFYHNLWAMADLHARLKSYEDAEEQKINPGDIVYVIDEERDGVREYSVSKVTYGKYHDVVRFVGGSRFTVWGREWDEYLGKYLFKTKEEAEAALARMEKE